MKKGKSIADKRAYAMAEKMESPKRKAMELKMGKKAFGKGKR